MLPEPRWSIFALFPPLPVRATGERRRFRPSTNRPSALDVGAVWREVIRIARTHPSYQRCLDRGWTRADLNQELLLRVHARQSMASRYNPARAGLAKYIFVTAGGILANLAVKQAGSQTEELTEDGSFEDSLFYDPDDAPEQDYSQVMA